MIKLYFHPSPNPMKVALFLEEAGLPYEMIPVDTRRGAQFDPEFLKINPNAKTPAIVDTDGHPVQHETSSKPPNALMTVSQMGTMSERVSSMQVMKGIAPKPGPAAAITLTWATAPRFR